MLELVTLVEEQEQAHAVTAALALKVNLELRHGVLLDDKELARTAVRDAVCAAHRHVLHGAELWDLVACLVVRVFSGHRISQHEPNEGHTEQREPRSDHVGGWLGRLEVKTLLGQLESGAWGAATVTEFWTGSQMGAHATGHAVQRTAIPGPAIKATRNAWCQSLQIEHAGTATSHCR